MNLLPDVEFFCNWDKKALMEFDDQQLYLESFSYKKDVELEWQEIEIVMMSYPHLFKPEIVDRGLFMRIFA